VHATVAVLAALLSAAPPPESVTLAGGEPGIGFDDLQLAPTLNRVMVPAGRTGRLFLIDPATRAAHSVAGISSSRSAFHGGHGEGTTSAAEIPTRPVRIAATDRDSGSLKIIDPDAQRVVSSTKLAAGPDYVRAVPVTGELWVTEPHAKQIEVLRIDDAAAGRLTHLLDIAVPGGPESLVIDVAAKQAYTHTFGDQSHAIDLGKHKVVASWKNGCQQSRGIALDTRRHLLFTGCGEGKVTVVDLATHRVIASATAGAGIDSIGYDQGLHHLYVPSGETAELAVFDVPVDVRPEAGQGGALKQVGRAPTAPDAHTVAVDPLTHTLFVGSPEKGTVLVIRDPAVP
jgi:DNA-binding beta-propeller fold protein YncE